MVLLQVYQRSLQNDLGHTDGLGALPDQRIGQVGPEVKDHLPSELVLLKLYSQHNYKMDVALNRFH